MSRPAAGRGRTEVLAFAELFALWGIALAQPLLDLLAKNAGVLITLDTSLLQALLFVSLVLFVPAVVCWAVEATLASIWPKTRPWVHGGFVACIVGVIVVEVVKRNTSLGSVVLVVAGALLGVGAAVLVIRFTLVRQFLRYLAVAPFAFAVLFFVASPAGDVLTAGSPTGVATEAGIERPHRVVFVVLDELPLGSLLNGAGRIDRELFPNLAGLADDATWYRNETTVAPYTQRAVPAVLSGRYPSSASALPIAADAPHNLFTLLGDNYEMNVHETVTRLCPDALCPDNTAGGLGGLVRQGLSLWSTFASPARTDPRTQLDQNLAIEQAKANADRFVESLVPTANPRLDFAHLELPHSQWRYLPTLQDYGTSISPSDPGILIDWSDAESAALARRRHLLQVQAADVIVGNILDKVRSIGAYDDALIVLTADHGVAFDGDEPSRAATEGNYPQVMWTPLMVKYPVRELTEDEPGRVDDRPAQSVDILPTVAEVLGVPVERVNGSDPVDGVSLLGTPRPEGDRPMYQWPDTRFQPDDVPTAPSAGPGDNFVRFDGAAGFREVLRQRAAPAGGDPALRIYRAAPDGEYIGRAVAPLVRRSATKTLAVVQHLERFEAIDPRAEFVPWAYAIGYVNEVEPGAAFAVAINGTIVAMPRAGPPNDLGASIIGFLVPPELVEPGRNDLTMYLVERESDDAKPALNPIPVRNARR